MELPIKEILTLIVKFPRATLGFVVYLSPLLTWGLLRRTWPFLWPMIPYVNWISWISVVLTILVAGRVFASSYRSARSFRHMIDGISKLRSKYENPVKADEEKELKSRTLAQMTDSSKPVSGAIASYFKTLYIKQKLGVVTTFMVLMYSFFLAHLLVPLLGSAFESLWNLLYIFSPHFGSNPAALRSYVLLLEDYHVSLVATIVSAALAFSIGYRAQRRFEREIISREARIPRLPSFLRAFSNTISLVGVIAQPCDRLAFRYGVSQTNWHHGGISPALDIEALRQCVGTTVHTVEESIHIECYASKDLAGLFESIANLLPADIPWHTFINEFLEKFHPFVLAAFAGNDVIFFCWSIYVVHRHIRLQVVSWSERPLLVEFQKNVSAYQDRRRQFDVNLPQLLEKYVSEDLRIESDKMRTGSGS